jgi:hypothetical protein
VAIEFDWLTLMGTHQGPVLRCTKPECRQTWNLSDNVGLMHVIDIANEHLDRAHRMEFELETVDSQLSITRAYRCLSCRDEGCDECPRETTPKH